MHKSALTYTFKTSLFSRNRLPLSGFSEHTLPLKPRQIMGHPVIVSRCVFTRSAGWQCDVYVPLSYDVDMCAVCFLDWVEQRSACDSYVQATWGVNVGQRASCSRSQLPFSGRWTTINNCISRALSIRVATHHKFGYCWAIRRVTDEYCAFSMCDVCGLFKSRTRIYNVYS